MAERPSKEALEEGSAFTPVYNADGLIPAIAIDAANRAVLMVAWMNAEAVEATLTTGVVHYFSRSRGRLWRKGEVSGEEQRLVEMRTDCDQDAIVVTVEVLGRGATCHTGRSTCFYRRVERGPDAGEHRLSFTGEEPLFDPEEVYGAKG
ncbi:MAG: phosphoribosyl-AMP cyclohydrolase [Hyphomicrobiales bacterium]